MLKEAFLKQFPKELEYEISKIYNLIEMAKEYDIISFTDEFYTPNIWKKLTAKMDGIYVFTEGLFEDSDRRQIAFVPECFVRDENFKIQFPIKLIRIEVNSKFKKYEHKDFLGSLMGLKLKRELMGDLILEGDFGYIPVAEKISEIIEMELREVGRFPCKVKLLDEISGDEMPKYKYDEKIITVTSRRLDSVVASIINLSRNKTMEAIEKGKVLIDYKEEKDKSKIIDIGSVITVRGYGKFKLFEEMGQSKKGKEKLIIKKYV